MAGVSKKKNVKKMPPRGKHSLKPLALKGPNRPDISPTKQFPPSAGAQAARSSWSAADLGAMEPKAPETHDPAIEAQCQPCGNGNSCE